MSVAKTDVLISAIDGIVRYEHVATVGSVPASPSVADRLAFWRRFYEHLAELANRIDAETQGKIISAVHSRIPIVTPDEQRALRVRPRLLHSAAPPHGSLTPADAPLIDAEKLFRQPGPDR